jgi:dihydropteroate synthase
MNNGASAAGAAPGRGRLLPFGREGYLILATRSETFEQILKEACSRRGIALMGVCNVTPDSFSDGGLHFSFGAACSRVDLLLGEGADIVDIGAESTRPGAQPVPPEQQLERMLEVVRYAATRGAVSVDTTSPTVASACLEAGAIAVNDVSCLADPALARVAAAYRAVLILMHARGSQTAMRGFSDYPDAAYGDIVADVVKEWKAAAERAMERGVLPHELVMDPGLGFSKNAAQSADLLRRTRELVQQVGAPVLMGASRKSFLTLVDQDAAPALRLGASIAAGMHAAQGGASILRVHDVRAARQAIDLSRLLRPLEAHV